MTVERIMNKDPVIISPDTPIGELRRVLLNSGNTVILVIEEDEAIGIIGDRDLLRPNSECLTAQDVMNTKIINVSVDCSISEACFLLINAGTSGLPVVNEDGHLVGVISARDIISGLVGDEGVTKVSVESASIYLAMTRSREYERYWLDKIRSYGYRGAITQVGASADRLAAKLRESMIAAAAALGVISEDPREKIAVSNAVRDAFIQLSVSNLGLGGGFKMAAVRGEGRVSVAIFGRFGHALVDGPEQLAVGYSII
ncbi:MAG: CBS domain-containing protein [Firmicutes bacterium]|nr:CBS domain-containing protein [Bacillota bacterium]